MGLMRDWYVDNKHMTHTHEYANKRKMEKEVETAARYGWAVTQVTPMSQGCTTQFLVPFAGQRYVVMYSRANRVQ